VDRVASGSLSATIMSMGEPITVLTMPSEPSAVEHLVAGGDADHAHGTLSLGFVDERKSSSSYFCSAAPGNAGRSCPAGCGNGLAYQETLAPPPPVTTT